MAVCLGLPQRAERPWPHDWYPYGEYHVVHSNFMIRLEREGVVSRDGLSFLEVIDDDQIVSVELGGRLYCPINDTAMKVEKRMQVRRGIQNRVEVRTVHYSYHAWWRGRADRPRRNLLRIDTNPHRPKLHAHLFDFEGREVESPDIDLDDMPTLDVFVRHVASARLS